MYVIRLTYVPRITRTLLYTGTLLYYQSVPAICVGSRAHLQDEAVANVS